MSKISKNAFRCDWKNKKQIGKLYNKTKLEISIIFKQAGLENPKDSNPTTFAIQHYLVKQISEAKTGSYCLWHEDRTCKQINKNEFLKEEYELKKASINPQE